MKVGMVYANVGPFVEPDGAKVLADAVEEAGIESIWTVEHVVVPSGYASTYPYAKSGRMPGPEDSPIPDPFIWLAFMAAATSTVKLATGIAILPQRNPVVTAKEVATLDRLAEGRMLLGVGAGWLEEEFDALGVPFERRGERLEEHIAAMRALWSEDKATYEGEFVSFKDCILRPSPAAGTVPVHIGGHTARAARRAGRLGDGFFPGVSDAARLEELLTVMRAAAEGAGRDPDAIEVTAGGRPDADTVRRFAGLGVHRFVVPPPAFDAEGLRAGFARVNEDLVPAA